MNIKQLNAKLKRLKRELMPDAKEMRQYAEIIKKDRQEKMAAGLDIDGNPFKPLKPYTIALKKAKGSPTPTTPLKDTGKLADKVTVGSSAGRGFVRMRSDRIDISRKHQYGLEGLPVRKHWGISKEAIAAIQRKFTLKFIRKVKGVMNG